MQCMKQTERQRAHRERERERGVGHIIGATSWADVGTQIHLLHMKWDMIPLIRTHKTVAHIFGATSWAVVTQVHLLHVRGMIQRKERETERERERKRERERESKREKEKEEFVTFLGQLPGQMLPMIPVLLDMICTPDVGSRDTLV